MHPMWVQVEEWQEDSTSGHKGEGIMLRMAKGTGRPNPRDKSSNYVCARREGSSQVKRETQKCLIHNTGT